MKLNKLTNITKLALTTALTLTSINALSQTQTITDTLSTTVYFHQSMHEIDGSFRNNERNLTKLCNQINNLDKDPRVFVNCINIYAGCSPEGSYETNEKLSRDRAKSIKNYITDNTALSPAQIKVFPLGVDWERFRESIEECEHPAKQRILNIIDMESPLLKTGNKTIDMRIEQLKRLDNGAVWTWLMNGIFNDLRQSGGKISCVATFMDNDRYLNYKAQKDTLVIIMKDTVYNFIGYNPNGTKAAETRKVHNYKRDSLFRIPISAIRTNLLMPLMNIGVEVPMGNRWSLEADWYSPWCFRQWMNKLTPYYCNCFQFQSAYLCTRIWLGRHHSIKHGDKTYRLRGHSIGIGFGAAHYDIGFNYKGQQGDAAAFGIDYKYAHPVGKGGVHFEFTVGICGYWLTHRDYAVESYSVRQESEDGTVTYSIYTNDRLIGTSPRKNSIGLAPFKAGISLVIPICRNVKENER